VDFGWLFYRRYYPAKIGNIMLIKNALKKSVLKKTVGFFLLVLATYSQHSIAQCPNNKNELSAQYQVSKSNQSGKENTYHITLFRHHSNVAYQYNNQRITEYWHQQKNGLIALTRYFDSAKKAIEYQPNEIGSKLSWQQINELISPTLRAKMHLLNTSANGCEQKFQLLQGEQKVLLTWLSHLNVVKELTIITPNQVKKWQLQQLTTSADTVAKQFAQWQQYQTTDYADIGDNEDDPFFAKMINLGFIEHTASGFYQADGQAIAAEHQH